MPALTLKRKLSILADAAKYDASCASSGPVKRNALDGRGVGSTDRGAGSCHAYAPDGRCICLLTNFCVYDCACCINKRLTLDDVKRACRSLAKVRPFIVADGWSPGALTDSAGLRGLMPKERPRQLELF